MQFSRRHFVHLVAGTDAVLWNRDQRGLGVSNKHVEALNIRRDRRRSLNLTKSQTWRDQ
jgi:hypothetical protein